MRTSRVPPFRVLLLGAAGLALAVILCWWVYDRFIRSDESKIRAVIEAAALAAEDRHPANVTRLVHPAFLLRTGVIQPLNRDECHSILVNLLMQTYRAVQVEVKPDVVPVQVAADRQTARAEVMCRVRAKRQLEGEWEMLQDQVGGIYFSLDFTRDGGHWLVREVRVSGKPAGASERK